MAVRQKKVVVILAVSLGIITFSFLLPIVIIPSYLKISGASGCAISAGCAGDTYSKCGAYESSGSSFGESLGRGMKGMLCMMGLDQGRAGISLWIIELSGRVIFNKLY
jgi:hypothetical protein